MKCFKTLICIMLVAVVIESCGRHSSKKEDDDSVPGMSLEDYQANRSDNDLPKSVNLEQKIDKLSYQNLRLLRAYVYAIHGHWFMEGDLNTFFFNHTKWYYDTCVKAHYPKMNDDQMEWELSAYGKEYSKLCDDDYEKTYSLVKLSPEEKKFVEARVRSHRQMMYRYSILCLPLICIRLMTQVHDYCVCLHNIMLQWRKVIMSSCLMSMRTTIISSCQTL